MLSAAEQDKSKERTSLPGGCVESDWVSEVVERFECVGLALTARGKACVEFVREVGGAGAEGFLRVTTILTGRKKRECC